MTALAWPPAGGVPPGHPGMTARVIAAVTYARLHHRATGHIDDTCGPHAHHWTPVAWACFGCGECEYDDSYWES